ncbi:Npt1/Npt2 family nucleotide transporter [Endozoicomonas ascidiicola]|uniref:Npt1/Npt2 family nucleotide transporter n=1 Tax=Endozoicomonas ascidiicola TaxID=1698521 RepID=UPI00082EF116|nr:Npt1/Npt2 family nucleotide transporter [Endozoicomonas ascidiicola]
MNKVLASEVPESSNTLLYLQITMMACCIFNFDILWNLKESLLVTRLGAEAIPFIKLCAVMPVAFIFLFCYSALANRLNKRMLFAVAIGPFLLWMPLFSILIYPNLDAFAPATFTQWLSPYVPDHLQFITGMIYYWPLTLFFALAEIWGSAVICILFWTSVNDLHNSRSAARHYPILTMVGSSASIISGPLLYYCASKGLSSENAGWQGSLTTLSVLFVIFGLMILVLNEYCYRLQGEDTKTQSSLSTTTHLPVFDSFKYLARCPYLTSIALMMLGYCISINMVELAWKSQLVEKYPSEVDYSMFMGKVALVNGIGSLLCGLMTPVLLNRSWFTATFATPFIILITAAPFFIFTLFQNANLNLLFFSSLDLSMLSLNAGLCCHALGKSAKYTLFNTTKEMTFVPLDVERKYKGKAAIELVVSRVGKAGSSLLQQILISLGGSMSLITSWLAGAFLMAIIMWLFAIKKLGKHYWKLMDNEP